jgi:hypothetical protein
VKPDGETAALAIMLALIVTGRALNQAFIKRTGMTLEEWDELSYQRVLNA